LGLIPPAILALYFLKLKRVPLEVPSTYLWHRVLEDLQVNSFWQRLRRSLLLLLQLAVVGLVMLALVRPGWQGKSLEGEQIMFLIDNSASMSATDAEGGQSRLEAAKQQVGRLIDQMTADAAAMIVTFAEQPEVVQDFTSDRRRLQDALAGVQPSLGRTDLVHALQLVEGISRTREMPSEENSVGDDSASARSVTLLIVSDGRFPPVEDFSSANLRPRFLAFGSANAQNLAITAFNTRRGEDHPGLIQAFVQVANLSQAATRARVRLFWEDRLVDAAEVELAAEGVASATFNLAGDQLGVLRTVVEPRGDFRDALQLDNTAYAVLQPRRPGRVLLVTAGDRPLETALNTERAHRLAKTSIIAPDKLAEPSFQAMLASEPFDLVVFDGCVPAGMPPANTLFLGSQPPLATWKESSPVPVPQIIDWDRSHPLMSFLELSGLRIAEGRVVSPPPGGRVLVDSTAGPLIAVAPRDRFEDLVIGFELVKSEESGSVSFNTDWPLKHSFPGFWLNVLDYFAGGTDLSQTINRPGQSVECQLGPDVTEAVVAAPDGSRRTLQVNQGRLVYENPELIGNYEVRVANNVVQHFAVNLFDRTESAIALTSQVGEAGAEAANGIALGYEDVPAESAESATRRDLWRLVLLLALVVLVLEWYIYNRRVYV
jgi:hypothetical protein